MAELLIALKRSLTLILFLSMVFSSLAIAQDPCPHGPAEAVADALEKTLTQEKSCSAAAARLWACAWGSSADVGFAGIVIRKCEEDFRKKLTPEGETSLKNQMQLCNYEYERQSGTLSISSTSLCHVDVAAAFAANPALASKPVARASFDCGKAETPLEKAICSDSQLGKADIVLSRVYASALKGDDRADKEALILNERQWLRSIPATCGLTAKQASIKSLNCVRIAFELRFAELDGCEVGGDKYTDCLKSPEDISDTDYEHEQTEATFEEDYSKAETAMNSMQKKQLVKSESDWQEFVKANCSFRAVGGTPTLLERACVDDAYKVRNEQLEQCPEKGPQEQFRCLNDFQLSEKWPVAQ
jgi:uncharacterized protein